MIKLDNIHYIKTKQYRNIMNKSKTYAIINQKGGSGKTTTAISIAGVFALKDYKVRLIDLDPQSASSTRWLCPDTLYEKNLLHFFRNDISLNDISIKTNISPNLDIIPSYITLKEIERNREIGDEQLLSSALKNDTEYDINVIDCPPSLDTLAISGVIAADELIIPVRASALDIAGMVDIMDLINKIKKRFNPNIIIKSILITQMKHSNLDKDLLDNLKKTYPNIICCSVRDSVKIREAISANTPINFYEPTSNISLDYRNFVNKLENHE